MRTMMRWQFTQGVEFVREGCDREAESFLYASERNKLHYKSIAPALNSEVTVDYRLMRISPPGIRKAAVCLN